MDPFQMKYSYFSNIQFLQICSFLLLINNDN